MSNPYIKDLIVRLDRGLPIHAQDVEWLIPALIELDERGSYQEGYENGLEEAYKAAEDQVANIWEEHQDDSRDDLLIAFQDFEVER